MGWFAPLMEPAPSIGLARLAAIARRAGWDVAAVDAYSERLSEAACVERIAAARPDVVGLTVLTASALYAERVAQAIRQRLPAARLVMGNVHAGFFAEDYVARGLADAVVDGEGENAFPALLAAWAVGAPPREVPGVVWRENGAAHRNAPAERFVDLDALPRPAWEIFPCHLYGMLPFVTMGKPALMVEGSRGCPFNCRFCCLKHLGRGYRARGVEDIVEEFTWLARDHHVRQIAFADALFPLTEEQGLAFCEALGRRRLSGFVWVTETRADLMTDRLAAAMKAAGCARVLFGIESGSQKSLDGADKRLTVEAARRAVEACRRHGVQTAGFFMLGFPGEGEADMAATQQLSRSLPLDIAKFNLVIPYPGAELYDETVADGRLRHRNWEDYSCYVADPDRLPAWLPEPPPARLLEIQREATRRFYLRLSMVLRHLFLIRSVPFKFLAIAGYNLTRDAVARWFAAGRNAG
jgi:radical SAM superfamily enzyme YgiQ (UPF0313 family)